jgi:3-oxoacyl-[acyl-carrier-protein] synthase-1
MTSNSSPVSVVGFAACTSLGYSLESTLAAMGAGLNNFSNTAVANEVGQPAVAASLIELDVPRAARLAALFTHGLRDLEHLLPRDRLTKMPVLIGVASDLTAEEMETMRRAVQKEDLARETAWYPYGRASTFAALAAAKDLIVRGSHPLVLVAGVDSLCASATVSSLVQAGRVLSPLTEGTIPGEAAVFALLARTADSIVEPSMAVVLEGVAVTRAPIAFTQARSISADGLASAFRTFRHLGATRVHRIVAAHSGEGYFGRSFGQAYLREIELMPEPLTVEGIADRVGDVGAAAGLLGMAFGLYLMVHDERPGSRTLVYSESDTGEVGAAIIGGEPISWQRGSLRD